MGMNRAALGALAVTGVVAIGAGTYLALRHPAPAAELNPAAAPFQDVTAAPAVTETENSITSEEAPKTSAASPAGQASTVERPSAIVRGAKPTAAAREERRATLARQPASTPAERPRPTGPASTSSPVVSIPADPPVAPAIEPVESTTVEAAPVAPDPPQRLFEDLVVPADSVIGLQIETAASSERAKVEDVVKARVTRDVKVGDRVAIPAGARAEGSITLVDKGGRLKDRARLGIRFHSIVLSDGTHLAINTETIYRDGESPARESAAKIGASSVGGAVLGAILGGKRGAIIGGTVGAAGGGAAVMASEPNPATLPAGSTVTVRVSAPVTVTVEK